MYEKSYADNKEKERKTKIIKKAQKQKPKPGKRVEG